MKAEKSQNKLNLKLTDTSVYNMEIKAHDLQTSEQLQSFINEISEKMEAKKKQNALYLESFANNLTSQQQHALNSLEKFITA